MLSYENPAGDFQGITYETPVILKKPPAKTYLSGGLSKPNLYRETEPYLRRFSRAIRER